MDWFESLGESMRRADDYNQLRQREHERMLADPCSLPIDVGCRVLVRAAFLGSGCGHLWEILECPVVEVSSYGVKVAYISKFFAERGENYYWIGRELVMEVLPPNGQPTRPQ